MSRFDSTNPYEVLGIEMNSTFDKATKARNALARIYHTDNNSTGNKGIMQKINNAYDEIRNAAPRTSPPRHAAPRTSPPRHAAPRTSPTRTSPTSAAQTRHVWHQTDRHLAGTYIKKGLPEDIINQKEEPPSRVFYYRPEWFVGTYADLVKWYEDRKKTSGTSGGRKLRRRHTRKNKKSAK